MSENRFFEYGGEVSTNATREEWLAARASYEEVLAWSEATAPVTFQQGWWRAVARPQRPDSVAADNGRVQTARWEVFAGEHADRHGVAYPAESWNGSFVGSVPGTTSPTAEAVSAMVAEWQENCE